MVFFTCNHCGDSAKKPAVAKHYQTKCRGAPIFVSCMDCMKDFKGSEYEAHIKCITEAEKYSAKGFVAKPSKNKGAMKQDTWTEIVKDIVNKQPNLDVFSKRVFERVAEQPNIPRKKAKFFNFLSNCMKINPNNNDRIWSIMEEAIKEFTEQTRPKKQNGNSKVEDEAAAAADVTNGDAKLGNESEAQNGKTKKSKKSKKADDVAVTEAENGNAEKPKKVKKSKKPKINGEANQTENTKVVQNGDAAKPKKAKKRKAEEPIEAVAETEESSPKKKKVKQSEETSFNWESEINKVLEKNGSLSTAKLQKKVLKKYEKVKVDGAVEENVKLEKRFSKGLRRSGAIVVDDVVSIAKE